MANWTAEGGEMAREVTEELDTVGLGHVWLDAGGIQTRTVCLVNKTRYKDIERQRW
jgi:hypothetical protein